MNIEEIYDDVSYYGDDAYLHAAIARALAKVPKTVLEFVLEKCIFLSTEQIGIVWPGRIAKKCSWIIILNFCDLEEDDWESVIAHEVAHAFLGHDRMGLDDQLDLERQACSLVKEWGFTGLGTDTEYCQS